jgi:WD40 repeat protein
MRDYFNPHEALQTYDAPFLQIGAISRRRFMVLLAAGLVAGCQATQGTAPTPTRVPASSTIPVLIPSAPIAPENANRVVQLALLEEDSIVRSVAWSPDGSVLAAGAKEVHLWDARTGKNLVSLQLNDKPNGVAWSPDGKRLAITVDEGAVLLWDAKTLKMLTLLLAHQEVGWSYAVTWSPDGRMLASSRQGGLVQLWDTRTGKELTALKGHLSQVRGTAWSPDGLWIASGSDDGTIRLWGVR